MPEDLPFYLDVRIYHSYNNVAELVHTAITANIASCCACCVVVVVIVANRKITI